MNILTSFLLFFFLQATPPKTYKAVYSYETPVDVTSDHSITLKADIIVFADNKCSMVYYENMTSDSKSFIPSNLPDTTIFKDSKWYKIIDNKKILMTSEKVKLKPSQIFKKIKGYNCQKIDFKADDVDGEYWICKDLPKNLTPLSGDDLLSGAVLEFRVPKDGILITLENIGTTLNIPTVK